MKKIILVLLLIFSPFILEAKKSQQLRTSYFLNGKWSKWELRNTKRDVFDINYVFDCINNFKSIHFYTLRGGDWLFLIEIHNFHKISKEVMKYHLKYDLWFEYDCTVAYYVFEGFPTIEYVLKNFGFPILNNSYSGKHVKRITEGKIMIAPFKKKPSTFYVFFDDVGIAFEVKPCPCNKIDFLE